MTKYVLLISLLVVGNLIGAGILALPIQTGGAGLIFSSAMMVVVCVFMYLSAVILAKEAVASKEENFNYPTLYARYMGNIGKWGAIAANMVILYGLLTAYLCGGTSIIMGIIGISDSAMVRIAVLTFLFIILSAVTTKGTEMIARFNGVLMLVLGLTFIVIVALGALHIDDRHELFFNVDFIPIAVPVILTSFTFHNIIPSISKTLNWNIQAISLAMLSGIGIGLVMNTIWLFVGIGVLPLALGEHSIVYAFEHGLPATVPMSAVLDMPLFTIVATIFALVAIFSSYVTSGIGLMDFNRDLAINIFKVNNTFVILVFTFIPPFLIALCFPNIFLKLMADIGGIGIAMLFGILPAVLCLLKTKSFVLKIAMVGMVLFFLGVVSVDLCDDFGIIKTTELIKEVGEKAACIGIE